MSSSLSCVAAAAAAAAALGAVYFIRHCNREYRAAVSIQRLGTRSPYYPHELHA